MQSYENNIGLFSQHGVFQLKKKSMSKCLIPRSSSQLTSNIHLLQTIILQYFKQLLLLLSNLQFSVTVYSFNLIISHLPV